MQNFWKRILSAIKGEEQDYTKGSINRAIFLLSIPMMIEMFGEGLFAIIDAYYLGKVSNEAAATAGIVEVVATLIYSLGIGIGIAATALVARRIGEQKPEAASKAAAQTIILSIGVAAILGVLGVVFAEDILRLMKAEEAVITVGTNYTRILLGSNVVIILLFVLNGVFRGAGDAFMAMISLWVANLTNIILDPLFIFGIGPFPEMGTTGAAIATSIGRGLGVAFQLYILFKGKRIIQLSWGYFKLIPDLLRRIVNVASTGSLQFFISSASWIFLARLVAAFGTDVYAGYFFAIRLVIFAILPAWGMANAAATLVGQNLGATQADRAATSVWRAAFFNMAFLFLVQVVFFFAAEDLIHIFTDSTIAIEAGTLTLRIICAGYVFFGIGMVLGQAFGGAGDTRTPTIVNFICFWLIEIPLAYFLSLQMNWGLEGVLWSIAISETFLALIFIVLFRRGKWKTVKV
ncbi:MAG: MATE family efflux transporter [Bacteroidota bacterium]